MTRRLPRTLWLDADVKITIKQEPPSMIEARYGEKGKAGFSDFPSKSIHIDRTLSRVRKWKVLRHELIHMLIDISAAVDGGL